MFLSMLVHRFSIVLRSSLGLKISPYPHPLCLGNLSGNQRFEVHNAVGIPGRPTPPSLSELLTEEDNAYTPAWVT
jgi:hypothetical protein